MKVYLIYEDDICWNQTVGGVFSSEEKALEKRGSDKTRFYNRTEEWEVDDENI